MAQALASTRKWISGRVSIRSSSLDRAVISLSFGLGPRIRPDGGILARTLSADASGLGAPFQVNANGPGWQDTPRVAFDALGSFMVTWTDHSGRDSSGNGVYARAFDAAGLPVGDDLLVNTTTQFDQDTSAIVATSADHYFAAWTDWSGHDGSSGGVYANGSPSRRKSRQRPPLRCFGQWRRTTLYRLAVPDRTSPAQCGCLHRSRPALPFDRRVQHLEASATSCLWRSPAPAVRGRALVRVSLGH